MIPPQNKVFATLWCKKKEAHADSAIKAVDKRLRYLESNTVINSPEMIKEFGGSARANILTQVIRTEVEAFDERVSGLLEGKNVNLRAIEKEDLPLLADWSNSSEFLGDYVWLPQQSRTEWEKRYDNLTPDTKWFFVEKKGETRIGTMFHWLIGDVLEISCILIPNERGKRYGTEAVRLMVDYLFLSRDITRIQAHTDAGNMVSQKVLQKAGFKKEGVIRKSVFARAEWKDRALFSILREEWKEPKVLTKTTSKR